jgi:hypothetical protein
MDANTLNNRMSDEEFMSLSRLEEIERHKWSYEAVELVREVKRLRAFLSEFAVVGDDPAWQRRASKILEEEE